MSFKPIGLPDDVIREYVESLDPMQQALRALMAYLERREASGLSKPYAKKKVSHASHGER